MESPPLRSLYIDVPGAGDSQFPVGNLPRGREAEHRGNTDLCAFNVVRPFLSGFIHQSAPSPSKLNPDILVMQAHGELRRQRWGRASAGAQTLAHSCRVRDVFAPDFNTLVGVAGTTSRRLPC